MFTCCPLTQLPVISTAGSLCTFLRFVSCWIPYSLRQGHIRTYIHQTSLSPTQLINIYTPCPWVSLSDTSMVLTGLLLVSPRTRPTHAEGMCNERKHLSNRHPPETQCATTYRDHQDEVKWGHVHWPMDSNLGQDREPGTVRVSVIAARFSRAL